MGCAKSIMEAKRGERVQMDKMEHSRMDSGELDGHEEVDEDVEDGKSLPPHSTQTLIPSFRSLPNREENNLAEYFFSCRCCL